MVVIDLGKFIDLTGKKFERLVVVEKVNNYHKKGVYWLCKCDCGQIKIVSSKCLSSKNVKSCGCLYKETRGLTATHKKSDTRLYNIWCHMKGRCYRKNHSDFKDYGGRQIKMCDEWKNDFLAFYNWAISIGYTDKEKLSIDRIDVNGNYTPENCRFANDITQARNRRNNHKLKLNNETKCISEWTEILGFKPKVISDRINKLGWSVEKALTTPLQKRGHCCDT